MLFNEVQTFKLGILLRIFCPLNEEQGTRTDDLAVSQAYSRLTGNEDHSVVPGSLSGPSIQ